MFTLSYFCFCISEWKNTGALPVLLDCKLIFAYAIGSSTSTKIKPVRNWILKNSWLIMNAGKFIKSRAYSIYSHNPIYLFLKLSYKLVHNLVSNLDICHPIQNPIKGVIIAKIISFILFLFFVKNYFVIHLYCKYNKI